MRYVFHLTIGLLLVIFLVGGAAPAWGAADDPMKKIDAFGPHDYEQMFQMAPYTDGAYSEGLASKLAESFTFDSGAFLCALMDFDEELRTRVIELLAWGMVRDYTHESVERAGAMDADLEWQLSQAEAKVNMIRDIQAKIEAEKKAIGLASLPTQSMAARQILLDLGYDIAFAVEGRMETDDNGFEYPVSDIEVILLYHNEPTGYRAVVKGLLGGVMASEENGWRFDEERLADTYHLPKDTVAGTQVYYAGGGDDVYVSFDPALGQVAVWRREFIECGPDTPIEDTVGEWQAVSIGNIATSPGV